jgi:hypothetical protein
MADFSLGAIGKVVKRGHPRSRHLAVLDPTQSELVVFEKVADLGWTYQRGHRGPLVEGNKFSRDAEK